MSWTLDGAQARWQDPWWNAETDLQQPSRGWALQPAHGESLFGLMALRTTERSTSGDSHLPPLVEHYSRVHDIEADYPEPLGGRFGLHVQVRVLESSQSRWIGQWTIAVQTSHWDCHPMLDLSLMPHFTKHYSSADLGVAASAAQPAPISPAAWTYRRPFPAAIVLSPHDQSVTGFHPDSGAPYLRLFEEFLERGVIRKATCWFVAAREPLPRNALAQVYTQLCETPLPLTT
jgi:hypothetical protein